MRTNLLRQVVWLLTVVVMSQMYSCQSINHYKTGRKAKKLIERSDIFSQYFIGFYLIDAETNEIIVSRNHNKHFTPASNTKIITLASYLSLGMDSIPSFLVTAEKQLIALADPTLLHPDFKGQATLSSLLNLKTDTIEIYERVTPASFGPGWAWDDYQYDFQPERSGMPLFGNIVRISNSKEEMRIYPNFFKGYIDISDYTGRNKDFNIFSIEAKNSDYYEADIPFKTSIELSERLLTDTLNKPVVFLNSRPGVPLDTIFNVPVFPVLSLMMKRSDNFLAEQLLLNAQALHGFINPESFISYVNQGLFSQIEQKPIWVDGSGLSRYNMVTPKSMVEILKIIYNELSWNEIQSVFPVGGVSGTVANWYKAEEPYIIAKTGTLRHNHNLSGFLRSRSGKIYIFSFMNNHYPFTSSSVAKMEMEKVLSMLRDELN